MASIAEQLVCRSLRSALTTLSTGDDLVESEPYRQLLRSLEDFLEVLAEVYQEWPKFESLDGVTPILARKRGEGQIEMFGVCILIGDQSVTPFHLHLQVAESSDEVDFLECRLGERGPSGMVRTPYSPMHVVTKRLLRLEGRADVIDWVYKVTFGQRRLSR